MGSVAESLVIAVRQRDQFEADCHRYEGALRLVDELLELWEKHPPISADDELAYARAVIEAAENGEDPDGVCRDCHQRAGTGMNCSTCKRDAEIEEGDRRDHARRGC